MCALFYVTYGPYLFGCFNNSFFLSLILWPRLPHWPYTPGTDRTSITHISPASNAHFASFCNLPLDDVTCGLAVQADYHCEPFYLWTVTQNEQIYWTTLRTVCATPHCCKPSADCTFSQSVRLWVSQESHGIKLSLSKSCQKHNLWITPQWCRIVDNISGYYSRRLWRILWDCHCVKFSIWFEEISLLTNVQIELWILVTVNIITDVIRNFVASDKIVISENLVGFKVQRVNRSTHCMSNWN